MSAQSEKQGAEDKKNHPLVDVAKAVGVIMGVPLALFAITSAIVDETLVALATALITAILASIWIAFKRWTGYLEVIVAWLALVVVVLAGFVIWPKTMTVEGTIRDTAGNPISAEEITFFDLSGRRYETKTDAEGYYQFIDVPTGKYRIQVGDTEVEGGTKGFLVREVQQNIVVALSPTPTPSSTPTDTSVPIPTPTSTDTLTPTATNSPTLTPTETPSPTATSTSAPTPTPTPTVSPTNTPTPTPTPTFTPMPTPTPAVSPTNTPTPMPSLCVIGESRFCCVDNGGGGTETIALEPQRTIEEIRIDLIKRGLETEYAGFSLWEVEIYGPGTGNLAIGATATASSWQNSPGCYDCVPGEAIDGDMNSRWSTQLYEPPQWFKITLSIPQVVDRIVLTWENAYAEEYCITGIE